MPAKFLDVDHDIEHDRMATISPALVRILGEKDPNEVQKKEIFPAQLHSTTFTIFTQN